ncbi:MAG: hypothetical protein ACRD44_07135, partial [Bryobacteraceae bacterium]
MIKRAMRIMGAKGGRNRAKALTRQQRSVIARKAGIASAKVRSAKAEARRAASEKMKNLPEKP